MKIRNSKRRGQTFSGEVGPMLSLVPWTPASGSSGQVGAVIDPIFKLAAASHRAARRFGHRLIFHRSRHDTR